jgi:hypothetical protein
VHEQTLREEWDEAEQVEESGKKLSKSKVKVGLVYIHIRKGLSEDLHVTTTASRRQ